MTRYALKNQGVIYFFFFLVLLLGINSIDNIPKQEFPEFPSWNAVVITRMPGASPQKMEELITEKIEEKLKEVGELDQVTSISQTGASYVFPKITDSIEDVEPVWDKVRQKLTDLQGTLPQGATNPWLNNDFGNAKSFVLAITGDGFNNRELVDIAKDMKKDFNLIDDVVRVDVIGAQQEQILVEFSNKTLAELGISGKYIAQILADQNVLQPGGNIRIGPQNIRLEPTGEYTSLEEIGNTVIIVPGSTNVFSLRDLATIKRQFVDPPVFQMRYMGQPAVGLVIEMRSGGQILELGQKVQSLIADWQQRLYIGVDIHIVNYQPKWVQLKIEEFVTNLWQAVLIVVVFMILLLGWREGIIIGVLIPFSFLITITILDYTGIPIHQISLVALIIALGMLVDNGIVMTESISSYVRQGLPRLEAASKAAGELTVPLLTSTGTTVAAFLPVALASSAVGIFCRTITYGVGIVLLSSFFVSMTLIPLLCTLFLKEKPATKPEDDSSLLKRAYRLTMELALRFRLLTVGLAVLTLVAVVTQLMPHVRQIFFPPSDRAQFLVDFYMPEGTDFRETRDKVLQAEQHILKHYQAEVRNMAIYIGEQGPRFQNGVTGEQRTSNYAQFVVNNHDWDTTLRMTQELQDYFDDNFHDAIVIVKKLESGPPVGAPIQIRVQGNDFDQLYAYTAQVKKILDEIPGTINIRDDWGDPIPKISVNVNQDSARRVGASTASLGNNLNTFLNGANITGYREGDTVIPVVGRVREEERSSLNNLSNFDVPTSGENTVPLKQIARMEIEWEAGKIRHRERLRTITVKAYVQEGFTSKAILKQAQEEIRQIELNHGYKIQLGGEAEESGKAQQSISVQIPLAMAILVMILVAQFGNVRKMLIILMTIPLSFIGVISGLLLFDRAFGFMAFLGVISLAGIVVNNAILLIEQIDADLAEGKDPVEAIISAGQRRSFPIVLTTLTTLSGLFPLALSGDFWGPMAVTIMGGLLVSTALTLVIIPTLYGLLFGIKNSPPPSTNQSVEPPSDTEDLLAQASVA